MQKMLCLLLTGIKVRSFGEIVQLVGLLSQLIASKGPNADKIETAVRQNLRGINTIPQIYGVGHESSASRKAVETLQIQLRSGTLELKALLADFRE
jgi:hypothetical protein